ncbi:ABC transporter substrate-binding protein [Ensifer sp. HO-A22]|uniref:ABC transporter substrate-binding protein n=1 Tax=Ensifer oleiphilus TaxID=2742698 RepID=A0A7Y6Q4M6_9HYPH|nr:ABC transporter substrate-binding protein [Ensifer oleiphilus]NVD39012.1 ABC transporter substrate-binding protein [Ensifer oleiphilus]
MKSFVSVVAGALVASLLSTAAFAESLVLYTSQPNEDAQATVDAFKAANPGVEVEWVREGTTKLMAKLMAEIEAGNPVADVLLIADTVTMQRLKEAGQLLAYKSPEAASYDAALYDADGAYYSTKMITTGIIYNTSAPAKPAGWQDLAKADAKGLVTMPSPLTSGAALIHAQTLAGIDGLGWDYYKALAENGATAAGGNGGVLKAVATGEKAYGMIVDFMAIREKAKGAPVEFVFPAEGVSAVTEPVGILKTAKNPDAAKKFVDFLISEEGQKTAVKMGYIPARNGVALPEGYPSRETIKVLPIDAAAAVKNSDADLKIFSGIFGTN